LSITAKERHRVKLVEYIGDPNNDFPSRAYMSTEVLKFSTKSQINRTFTPEELREIESEALELRRKKCARQSIEVDKNLIENAKKGDNPKWVELYYKRFEGWAEKKQHEHSGPGGGPVEMHVNFVGNDDGNDDGNKAD